jgi:alpha-galactosidase
MHIVPPVSSEDEPVQPSTTEQAWFVKTPALEITWSRIASGDVRLTSLRTAGFEWIASPTPLFSLVDDAAVAIAFDAVTADSEKKSVRLRGSVAPLGLTVSIVWTAYEESSVVAAEIEVINETDHPIEVGNLTSLHLLLGAGGGQLGVLAGGRWDEAMPPRGFRLQTMALDEISGPTSFGAADDGRSSGDYLPWLALMAPGGGLFAALVWSGRWQLQLHQVGDAHSLAFGISDFAHLLQPGERLAMPGVILSGYTGDLDDGANSWRDWVNRHWTPAVPENWPWVQYNHWYAYAGDISADRLLAEAKDAAEVGCEVFVIDDGWFRGRRPESYFAGWGDWVEDIAKFPDGLGAFRSRVHQLGMKFGLWVEPERADNTGELLHAHPGWVATRDGEPIARQGRTGAEGVHLCLGNPEVQRWMIADMVRVVREYGVDWLKWDYNIGYGLGCNAESHGHQTTDGHYAHTLGLYHVLGSIMEACPDLMIENCASGGHRVDLGMLRYAHTSWISDYTHRAASCRQHVQGAGLFLPLHHLNTWVLDDRTTTEFRSRMGGAFGVSCHLGHWTSSERDLFGHAVSEYRRLRPFLGGQRFLLTGPLHQDWEIWQLVHPSGDQFAVLAFREAGQVTEVRVDIRIPPRDQSYLIQRSDDDETILTASELRSHGLTIHLPDRQSSEVIWVTALR